MPEASQTRHQTSAVTPEMAVRQGQIVTVAFIAGVVALAVAGQMAGPINPDPGLAAVLSWVLIAMAVVAGIGIPLTRKLALRSASTVADPRSARDAAAGSFLGQLIAGNALIEGVGILGGVTHLLTGEVFGLLAAGASVAVLGTRIPNADRYDRFVEVWREAR